MEKVTKQIKDSFKDTKEEDKDGKDGKDGQKLKPGREGGASADGAAPTVDIGASPAKVKDQKAGKDKKKETA